MLIHHRAHKEHRGLQIYSVSSETSVVYYSGDGTGIDTDQKYPWKSVRSAFLVVDALGLQIWQMNSKK